MLGRGGNSGMAASRAIDHLEQVSGVFVVTAKPNEVDLMS